ncbi:MAG: TolC family protein [Muribaculaceae bacterium]|nr:TolC family protein [Muribaculaceae bacterium]
MKIRLSIIFLSLIATLQASAIDLSLQQCRDMAIQSDELIKIAKNRVTQSNLDRGIAKTAYLPKIDGSATALYLTPNSKVGDAMELQMKGVYLAGFSLTQPIFTGLKIVTANKLAGLGQKAAQQQMEATTMDVIANAEKSYWMLMAVRAKIDMIDAYIMQLDSILSYTTSAYELGLTTRLNVSRVETKLAELQYRRQQAKSGEELCRLSLCRIIGVEENSEINLTENIDYINDRLVFTGIESRPELHLSMINVTAKKHDVAMVRADFLPTLGLQLGWNAFGNLKMKNYMMLDNGMIYPYTQSISYKGFVGALALSVPIFHWGEGFKKVKKAKIEVENAELELEQNRKLMDLQARQAYNNYIDGFSLIESARKAFSDASLNLEMMKDQYEAGLMTLTDLLDAQSQWHTSYSNLIEAKTQLKINEVDYLRSTGEIAMER